MGVSMKNSIRALFLAIALIPATMYGLTAASTYQFINTNGSQAAPACNFNYRVVPNSGLTFGFPASVNASFVPQATTQSTAVPSGLQSKIGAVLAAAKMATLGSVQAAKCAAKKVISETWSLYANSLVAKMIGSIAGVFGASKAKAFMNSWASQVAPGVYGNGFVPGLKAAFQNGVLGAGLKFVAGGLAKMAT